MNVARRPKIVLLGMLSKIPVGGVVWLMGHYAVGFQRLGFDVYYVESHARTPSMFMEPGPEGGTARAAAFIEDQLARFGLGGKWAFQALHEDGRCYGMSEAELRRLYRDAALIINLHGGTAPLEEHTETGRLVYMGTDPVDVELEVHWGEQRTIDFLSAHVAFFTWGLNYGNPDCRLPWHSRFPFVPSPPPVLVDHWYDEAVPPGPSLTTVGNWRQTYRDVEFDGERYTWSKHHEFLKVLDLPRHVGPPFELALSSCEPQDRQMLEEHGWSVRSGLDISRDGQAYREFIQGSRGEFSVAKDQNVRLRSGWFSERSAAYLAAGRPVILQDTGFGNALPVGEGLLTFRDLDEAVASVEALAAHPARHREAAVAVAREHLAAEVVLARLLDHVGLSPSRRPLVRRRLGEQMRPPDDLVLEPVSRRPLVLDEKTREHAVTRPVPMTGRPPAKAAVSVVVVTFDNLAVTRLCLESVLLNSDEDVEIVVVDNSSDPETRQYVSVLAARNVEVRLVQNGENRGFAAAANQGLQTAVGDILVLLNNDVVVPPGWLQPLVAPLDDGSTGLVGPVTNRCGNAAQVEGGYRTYEEMVRYAAARRTRCAAARFDIPVAEMFCVAFRRPVFEVVGPLDERFGQGLFEDDDYSRRVRQAGLRVICAEDAFVHHFGEASLGTLAAAGLYGELFERNRRQYEEKWGVVWEPHERRQEGSYDEVVADVRRRVDQVLPVTGVVAVISKGDSRLVDLGGRTAWHFPCLEDGRYAGFYPEDSRAAIDHLRGLIERGLEYLVVPSPAFWWLEHYREFAEELTQHDVIQADERALIVDLSTGRRPPLGERRRRYQLRQLAELVGAVTAPGEAVVVVTPHEEDAALLGGATRWADPRRSDVHLQLEGMARAGARLAVVPAATAEGTESLALGDSLRGWQLLTDRPAIGALYEVIS